MKNVLLPVLAFVTITTFASSAHAGGSNAPSGSTGVSTYDSVHSGTVTPTCSLEVTDGALGTVGLASSITSTTTGSIKTVCNSTSSTLTVTAALFAPTNPAQTLTTQYELSDGTGAYAGADGPAAGFRSAQYSKENISNGFSTNSSNLTVKAKVIAPAGQNLASGAYTVKVTATVSP